MAKGSYLLYLSLPEYDVVGHLSSCMSESHDHLQMNACWLVLTVSSTVEFAKPAFQDPSRLIALPPCAAFTPRHDHWHFGAPQIRTYK
jgi:hypothetical protein